ncbi:MAG TPA: anthranilate synthase component I [Terriglobales bacterium]|nr:anthranilate synthase component I [Terriglobales bacterium]
MIRPTLKEFMALARTATLVPVAKSVSADLLTPVSAFLSFAADEPYSFLLESVEGGEKIGRYTFLGANPYMRLICDESGVVLYRGRKQDKVDGEPVEVIRQLLKQHQPAKVPGLPPFTAGAVGFVSYDMVRRFERLPKTAKQDVYVPDCVLTFYDRVLAFDHVRHQIHIMAAADLRHESPRRAYERAVRDIEAIEKKLAKGFKPPKTKVVPGKLKVKRPTPQKKFEDAVRKAKDYIAAGDIFQVVLSQRAEFEPGVEPFQIYRALRRVNPSPYMYYLKLGENTVLGSSPEMLVRVKGRELEYRPIAGTRWRGKDEVEDQRIETELLADEKERAEHVMLVDLGRNDVGRVSEYGSVKVRDLMFVEKYSHVMHLVSAIEGKLREGLDAFDAFASCFPAGTLSGAPKVRAMEIIEELEPLRRGVYGGSVLYADFAGNLDSCIAIRTMFTSGKRAFVQAGAGIVADSVPQREYEECVNKARALVHAVELARSGE